MSSNTSPLIPGLNHFIPLGQAKAMTALYRANMEKILAPEYQGKDILSICETFNRDIFDAILAEEGCVAMRVYFGMDPDMKIKVILVGVDAKNQDILPSSKDLGKGGDGGGGYIGEEGLPCPQYCPVPPL